MKTLQYLQHINRLRVQCMLLKEWSRVLPLLAYKDLEWPERKWLPRNWPECVPNSDARGEVALLAILVDFEGDAKDPPPKTRRGERSRG